MQLRSTLFAFGVALGLAGCATARVQPPSSALALSDCSGLDSTRAATELYAGKITRVEPRYRQEFLARAIQPRYVAGANLYVPAEQGVSRAYLQRVLTCHAASGSSSLQSDPLRANGVVKVDVFEAGPAMRIAVIGRDRHAGADIWQRAVALQDQQGSVSVQQL
jgi:hypothetical protein